MKPRIIITIQSESGVSTSLTLSELSEETWACIFKDVRAQIAKLDHAIQLLKEIK